MTRHSLDGARVALVDDHTLFLEGLSGLLRGMGKDVSVTSFSNGLEFVADLRAGSCYDLVVTDLTMRQMNGLAIVAQVTTHLPDAPVIVLTGIDSGVVEADILAAGASAFLNKSCAADELHAAFLHAFARKALRRVPSARDAADLDAPLSQRMADLSQRQLEVLHLLGNGASNKEISSNLNISENTVKSHLKMIFAALGVNRRTASIQKARALGII